MYIMCHPDCNYFMKEDKQGKILAIVKECITILIVWIITNYS